MLAKVTQQCQLASPALDHTLINILFDTKWMNEKSASDRTCILLEIEKTKVLRQAYQSQKKKKSRKVRETSFTMFTKYQDYIKIQKGFLYSKLIQVWVWVFLGGLEHFFDWGKMYIKINHFQVNRSYLAHSQCCVHLILTHFYHSKRKPYTHYTATPHIPLPLDPGNHQTALCFYVFTSSGYFI